MCFPDAWLRAMAQEFERGGRRLLQGIPPMYRLYRRAAGIAAAPAVPAPAAPAAGAAR